MIRLRAALFLAILLSPLLAHPRYHRAMIMNGGGLKTAIFLGALAAARDQGKAPDVLVATCGGSLAALLANRIEDSQEQLDFVLSRRFFEALKGVPYTGYAENFIGPAALFLMVKSMIWSGALPTYIFDYFTMEVSQSMEEIFPGLNAPLSPGFIPVVLVAMEVLFDFQEHGKFRQDGAQGELFAESFFTDSHTASLLEGFPSPMAAWGGTFISLEPRILANTGIVDAARASIADPFIMPPKNIDGRFYITGAGDLYPIELSRALADEVMMFFTKSFDSIERDGFLSVFGYDINQRLNFVQSQKLEYWIDATHLPDHLSIPFGFTLSEGKVSWNFPETYEQYRELVAQQFQLGYDRFVEALANRGSQSHVRSLKALKIP